MPQVDTLCVTWDQASGEAPQALGMQPSADLGKVSAHFTSHVNASPPMWLCLQKSS